MTKEIKNSILDEISPLASPVANFPCDLNSSLKSRVNNILSGRDCTMTNLTVEELVDVSEKLVQKSKLLSAINLCK